MTIPFEKTVRDYHIEKFSEPCLIDFIDSSNDCHIGSFSVNEYKIFRPFENCKVKSLDVIGHYRFQFRILKETGVIKQAA